MRTKFNEQLTLLHTKVMTMGNSCEHIIALAISNLKDTVQTSQKEAKQLNDKIEQLEREIEALCLSLLLKQQPVASDLRTISATLKLITDMRRIGNHAEMIVDILHQTPQIHQEYLPIFDDMAKAMSKMVKDSLKAYVTQDLELAKSIAAYDDVVDAAFTNMKNMLVEVIKKDSDKVQEALDILLIAKYIERMGDRSVNIAMWVEYSITGEHKEE